jgi:hypothetical protein
VSRRKTMHCDCEKCRKRRRKAKESYPEYCQEHYVVGIKPRCFFGFKYLIILILIILQFGKKDEHIAEGKEKCKTPQLIDNSILFIIAIYFLTCWLPD